MHRPLRTRKATQPSRLSLLALVPLSTLVLASSFSHSTLKNPPPDDIINFIVNAAQWISSLTALGLFIWYPGGTAALRRNWPVLILIGYMLLATLWSSDILIALLNLLRNTGTMLAALVAALYLARHKSTLTEYLWPALLSSLVLLSLFDFLFIQEVPLGRMKGLNGDPTTLGADAMLAIWACTAALLSSKEASARIFLGCSIGLSAIILIGTKSITPLVTALVIAGLMVMLFKLSEMSRANRSKIIILLIYIVLPVFFLTAIFFQNILSIEFITGFLGKDSTFSGRTIIWDEAISLINQKTLTGWGLDYLETSNSNTLLWHNHYHNGYLDISVRLGLLGLLIIALILGAALHQATRFHSETFRTNLPFISLLIGLLVYNITEVTFVLWDSKAWILTLTGVFVLTEARKQQGTRQRIRKKRRRRRKQPININEKR